jgi:hypothetical protein
MPEVTSDDADRSALLLALTTEHFVLQSAASTITSESATRATLYVMSLSSSLVALGFAAQSETAFVPLAAGVIPTVFLLGVFTVVRLIETGAQNMVFLRRMVRIRRYYRDLAPEAVTYFGTPGASETDEVLAELGVGVAGRLAPFFTLAMMVAMINGIVGGGGVALLAAEIFGTGWVVVSVLLGLTMFAVTIAACRIYQQRTWHAGGW